MRALLASLLDINRIINVLYIKYLLLKNMYFPLENGLLFIIKLKRELLNDYN